MPGQVGPVRQRFVRGVVHQQQFPFLNGQRLFTQGLQDTPQVMWARIVSADDDAEANHDNAIEGASGCTTALRGKCRESHSAYAALAKSTCRSASRNNGSRNAGASRQA